MWELGIEVEEGIGTKAVSKGVGADGQCVERRSEGAEAKGSAGLECSGEGGWNRRSGATELRICRKRETAWRNWP
uniref:DUF834 domain-containing protein n=1 Tax=Oryza brachyantha TaxID=4533 RepID=J3MMD8_ORYBR